MNEIIQLVIHFFLIFFLVIILRILFFNKNKFELRENLRKVMFKNILYYLIFFIVLASFIITKQVLLLALISFAIITSVGLLIINSIKDTKNMILTSYVINSLKKGFDEQKISSALINTGWPIKRIKYVIKNHKFKLLKNYIDLAFKKGHPKQKIISSLKSAGWKKTYLNRVIKRL